MIRRNAAGFPGIRRLLLVLVLTLVPGGCDPGGGGDGRPDGAPPATGASPDSLRLTDASGRVHRFQEPPRRILSLVPSATRILLELGAEELLVGRTDWDTVAAVAHLPSVGGGLRPSLERIVTLGPDLVVRFQGESDRVTPRRLDELGVRHFAIRPDGIEDIRGIVRDLARIVGRPARGDSLVHQMDRELDEIRERVAGRPRPSVVYLLGGTPPMVAGPGTFIDEIIRIAGGRNAFGDLEALYAQVSPEELVARDVDVVLHPPRVVPGGPPSDARWAAVSAPVETPGPDLTRGAREIARILHPGAFR